MAIITGTAALVTAGKLILKAIAKHGLKKAVKAAVKQGVKKVAKSVTKKGVKKFAKRKAKDFAKENPVGGYATVELGKGIIGKLMKVKGAIPGVVGGTVGRRSARGGGGL